MVLLSNKCVWKTRNPHPSRLPDGSILPQTDSGHFAVATLGSYPATISCTRRVLRHVLTNDLCNIASLINNRGAKSLLTSFHQTGGEAPVEGLYAPKYGSPVRGAQHRSAGCDITIKECVCNTRNPHSIHPYPYSKRQEATPTPYSLCHHLTNKKEAVSWTQPLAIHILYMCITLEI